MALEELQNSRYHSLRLLGSGGMGEVYLMQDMRVNRQVAIKIIRSESSPYPDSDTAKDAARLFQREARAIAALEHPNILPLYDFGEEIREGTAFTYMVMPFCTEGTLASWLRQRSGDLLSPQDISYLVEQAADALQYAHDHQVIHLDVKSSNFLLRSNKKNPNRPTLLLADFGIARSFTTVASSSLTIRGTPTSMAPEQWSSTPVPATDQYALAVTAYELLTGRPPFVGSLEQLMFQHFSTQPPPPSTFNPRVPGAIDLVILRALEKRPEDRFPSIAAFANAFEQAALLPTESVTEQQRTGASNMYATLAVTQAEADSGISRMITLPGGRQINVPIPAGARDGQVIRLQGFDDSSSQPGQLILTVAVKRSEKVEKVHLSSSAVSAEQASGTARSSTQRPPDPVSGHDLPTVAASEPAIRAPEKPLPPAPKRSSALRFGTIAIISVLVIALLLGSGLYFYSSRQQSTQQSSASLIAHSQTATAVVKLTPSPITTAVPRNGLYIAGTYNGSMFNETTQQTTDITVFIVQTQGNGALSGSVTFKSSPQGVYPLSGTVDTQGNFSFAIHQSAGQTPLLFYGAVQNGQNGSLLHGNFCNSNTNTCLSNTGYFTVGPRF
jgi:serine/threonine protein kinase